MAGKRRDDPPAPRELSEKQLRFAGEEDAVAIYSNFTSIDQHPWDLKLRFGQIVKATNDEFLVRRVADVTLSPQSFKALAILAAQSIREYERIYGKIKLPGLAPKQACSEHV